MSEVPVLPFVKPGMKRPPPGARAPRSNVSVAWSSQRNEPVEVVAPDRYCADRLLEFAAPIVPAGLVPGAALIVRLHPPLAARGGWWVLEVLSLLDRWLESVPLPCAKVLYGGQSYLIRSPIEAAEHGAARRSAFPAPHAFAD